MNKAKVITGTAGEAIHILDGLVSHDSAIDILAHHTDGRGVSDHVFAAMCLLGVKFRPRMSSPNERRLYAFEAKSRYGALTPFMGEWIDRKLIEANWDDVQRVIAAFRNRVVTPLLILRNSARRHGKVHCRPPRDRTYRAHNPHARLDRRSRVASRHDR